MFDGQFVFAQLLDFLPRRDFNACVERYRGNHKCRGFFCRDQFLALVFAQLPYRESLRDVEICLRTLDTQLYHAGFRSKISRSTMAGANQRRDWRIFADFAHILIRRPFALRERRIGSGFGTDGLRSVLDHYPRLLEPLPMGQILPPKRP